MYDTVTFDIVESIYNGQWRQAKTQLQQGCKTKPEVQARRLGWVVFQLMYENLNDNGESKVDTFVNMFGERICQQ